MYTLRIVHGMTPTYVNLGCGSCALRVDSHIPFGNAVHEGAHTLIGYCTTVTRRRLIRKWSEQLYDDVNNNSVQYRDTTNEATDAPREQIRSSILSAAMRLGANQIEKRAESVEQ